VLHLTADQWEYWILVNVPHAFQDLLLIKEKDILVSNLYVLLIQFTSKEEEETHALNALLTPDHKISKKYAEQIHVT